MRKIRRAGWVNVGARIAAWEEGVGWNVRAWQFTEVFGNFESKNYFNITNSFGHLVCDII